VLAVIGAVLAALGMMGMALELAHGADIWRKGNWGIAPLVVGAFCVWHGVSERERGAKPKPIWPALMWLAVLLAIGLVLYLVAPPLAFVYAIVVGIIVRFSLLASWIGGE
jgi:hypothetical protein